jgi:aldehyde dehydrogenase (NAD+)
MEETRVTEDLLHRIGDRWEPAADDRWIDVEDPSSGETFARLADGTSEDVDRAVAAARQAFAEGPWRRLPVAERAEMLRAVAAHLEARMAELTVSLATDTGTAAKLCGALQVYGPVMNLRAFADMEGLLAEPQVFDQHEPLPGQWRLTREPLGVVGAFVPYNFPMYEAVWKFAPAALAGNSVVMKAAPTTPVGVQELARACEAVGIPPGVLNVAHGGAETGRAIAGHRDVDVLTFTGSSAVARDIMRSAAANLTPVMMELGGKSPAVVLPDADLDLAVRGTVFSSMMHAGQVCVATTRMLVPSHRYDEAVDAAAAYADALTVGPALAEGTDVGPVNSAEQLARIESFVESAVTEGAKVAAGGARPTGVPDGGHYLRPTVLRDVTNDMRVAREEIFGPVLSVIAYDGVDDAVAQANDSRYGLAASVWSQDEQGARAVADRLEAGLVWINDAGAVDVARTPMAGRKESGVGTELGPDGLFAYTVTKSEWSSRAAGMQAAAYGMMLHPSLGPQQS